MEDGVILDVLVHHKMCFLICVPNFSFLSLLEVCQESPRSPLLEDVDDPDQVPRVQGRP